MLGVDILRETMHRPCCVRRRSSGDYCGKGINCYKGLKIKEKWDKEKHGDKEARNRPRPSQARPKPGLSGQARLSTSLDLCDLDLLLMIWTYVSLCVSSLFPSLWLLLQSFFLIVLSCSLPIAIVYLLGEVDVIPTLTLLISWFAPYLPFVSSTFLWT